jgi:GNAT superfamily N-acetyltransferase
MKMKSEHTIIYRMANARDVPDLARLRWEFDREEDETSPVVSCDEFLPQCCDFLQHGLETGTWTYWVAEADGEIVSHIFVHVFHPVPRPTRLTDFYGYMTNVYTRPAYRNQGIGSTLMQHVLDWAKTQNIAFLIVSPSERSVPFYYRAGFAMESEFMELTFR